MIGVDFETNKNGSLVIRHFHILPVNLPLKSGFEEMGMRLFNLSDTRQNKPKSNYNK